MLQASSPSDQPPASPTTRVELPSLTGVRAVGAGAVFVGHAALTSLYRDDAVNFGLTALSATVGHAAVSLFFALSGFVLTWSHRPGDSPRSFIRRRLAKIGPNHVVTWSAGLVLMLIVGTASGAATLLPSLLLVHAWVPELDVVVGTNGPNWSLSAELFFYATFPFLLPVLLRIRPDRLWHWAGALMVGSFMVPIASLLIPAEPILYDIIPVNRFWLIAFFPLSRMFEFVIGVLVARMVLEGRWKPIRHRTMMLTFLGAWIISAATPPPYGWVAPFLLPIALGIGTMATRDAAGTTGWVGSRRMVWLGQMSFGFYLIHSLMLDYGHRAIGGGTWGYGAATALLAAACALSLGLAVALQRYVEVPAYRRWARRRAIAPGSRRQSLDAAAVGRLVDRELQALAAGPLAAVPRAAANAPRGLGRGLGITDRDPLGTTGDPDAASIDSRR